MAGQRDGPAEGLLGLGEGIPGTAPRARTRRRGAEEQVATRTPLVARRGKQAEKKMTRLWRPYIPDRVKAQAIIRQRRFLLPTRAFEAAGFMGFAKYVAWQKRIL